MDMKKRVYLELGKKINEFLLGIQIVKCAMDMEDPEMGDAFLDVLMDKLSGMRSKPVAEPVKAEEKAMISQPMGGKTDEEIIGTRDRAVKELEKLGLTVVNTLFTDEWYSKEAMAKRGVVQMPLCFLAKSLENMSLCHVAYFCKGWEQARGCRIEHEAAKTYGLKIIYEEE